MKKPLLFFLIMFLGMQFAKANLPLNNSTNNNPSSPIKSLATGCLAATAQAYLDINNVRAMILSGGDMWWDFSSSKYEIPQGSGISAIFCGAIWIGGLDPGGQIHAAAMTYRQTGNDFWPGPLDTVNGYISDSVCDNYDKVYKVSRSMVDDFLTNYTDPDYTIPDAILNWPGNGNTALGQAKYLAPFVDVNGDGVYNPLVGDYPGYNLSVNQNCCSDLLGDQTLWWVFNDAGNIHTETGGLPLGFEIQAQAFAFKTTDALNDATFYQYKVINRSPYTYNEFYWGQFVDVDLGLYDDDFVGCDVARGMGYCYNGDSNDGGGAPGTYGLKPPAVGLDFVGGPFADANDGIDNDRDSIVDEIGERIKMTKCMYYNGDNTSTGNPNTANDFYGFLKGRWKDNTSLTYGGNGHQTGADCDFMFPGTTDPYGWGTNGVPQLPWDEASSLNTPADRRFLITCGPFTMQPGQVQCITTAAVWARDTNSTFPFSVTALQQADDLAQWAFDNCFNLPCYIPQPEIVKTVNERTVFFSSPELGTSYSWNFGDGNTSALKNPKHIYSLDGTYTICLTVTRPCGSATVCDTLTVEDIIPLCSPIITRIEGQGNGGLTLEFSDATLNEILYSPNHRSLFPIYKQGKAPVQIVIDNPENIIEGNYAIKFDSVQTSSHWKMYRIGTTDTVYADTTIAPGGRQYIPQWGMWAYVKWVLPPGNVNAVKNGVLTSTMTFENANYKWLTGLPDNDIYNKDNWIRSGLVVGPSGNTCLGSYNDYTGLDNEEYYETILGGTWSTYRMCASKDVVFPPTPLCYYAGPAWELFQNMNLLRELASVTVVITADKTKWTRCPVFELCEDRTLSDPNNPNGNWTARKMDLRTAPSVDKEGRKIGDVGAISGDTTNADATDYINATGMGWFPGYAVNLETGERLNMAFGENSWLMGENGRDMLWNPTATVFNQNNEPIFGGQHYIYIFGHNGNSPVNDVPLYDYGMWIRNKLNSTNSVTPVNNDKRLVYADAMWVNIPLLAPNHSLFETDVKINLCVAKPYARYNTSLTPLNNDCPLYTFSINNDSMQCIPYKGEINMFPNIFSDYSYLEFENPEMKPLQIKIYDVQGRLVQQYINVTTDKITILSFSLARGMYFYQITGEGEKPRSGKFVVGE